MPGGARFEPDDVAFIFLPEELHDNARSFFEEHRVNHTGPAYLCRYVDPRWSYARIARALSGPIPAPPAPRPFRPSPVNVFAGVRAP